VRNYSLRTSQIERGELYLTIRAFNTSNRGAGHIKNGIVCQDASLCGSVGNSSYAVVCDGHGGDIYVRSNIGAEIATETAKKLVVSFIQNVNGERFFSDPQKNISILQQHIVENWRKKVNEHWNCNPFAKEELAGVPRKVRKKYNDGADIESAYGTTAIVAVMTEDYWFVIQIGDGKCITISADGQSDEPVPPDPRCFENITTSLCDPQPLDSFRACYFHNSQDFIQQPDENGIVHFKVCSYFPSAIIIGTDGVDNSFNSFEKLSEFYKGAVCYFSVLNPLDAKKKLDRYLNEISLNGSQDDVSVAGLFSQESVAEWEEVKVFSNEILRETSELPPVPSDDDNPVTQTFFNFCPMCASKLKPKSKICLDCGLDLSPFFSLPILFTNNSKTKLKKSNQRHQQQIFQPQIQPPRKSKKEQIQSDKIPVKEKNPDVNQDITEPIFSDIKINYDDTDFDGSINIDPVPDLKSTAKSKKKN